MGCAVQSERGYSVDRWRRLRFQAEVATADDRCEFCTFYRGGTECSLLGDPSMPEEDRRRVENAIRIGIAWGCLYYRRK